MSFSNVKPAPQVLKFRDAVTDIMEEHVGIVEVDAQLAVLAHIVGTTIAAMGHYDISAQDARELVDINIRQGYEDGLAFFFGDDPRLN